MINKREIISKLSATVHKFDASISGRTRLHVGSFTNLVENSSQSLTMNFELALSAATLKAISGKNIKK